jgi:hypothetical protein
MIGPPIIVDGEWACKAHKWECDLLGGRKTGTVDRAY